jgi:hypothetical protein
MMDNRPTFQCDSCGVPKKDTNHWFVAWSSPRTLVSKCVTNFYLSTWDEAIIREDNVLHLCGDACAHKALNYFLEHKSLYGFQSPVVYIV